MYLSTIICFILWSQHYTPKMPRKASRHSPWTEHQLTHQTYTESRESYRVYNFTVASSFFSYEINLRWTFSLCVCFPVSIFVFLPFFLLLTLPLSHSGWALSDQDYWGIIPPSHVLPVLRSMCRLTILHGRKSSYFRLAKIDPLWDKLSTCQHTLLLIA